MVRLIDADATVKYLREFRCADCDRRKGLKNGKVRFCYEIGDAPCRACDIGDTIEYFLDEDISPTVPAITIDWLREKIDGYASRLKSRELDALVTVLAMWEREQEGDSGGVSKSRRTEATDV